VAGEVVERHRSWDQHERLPLTVAKEWRPGAGRRSVVEKSADGNWEMSIKPDPGWEKYTKGHPDGTFRAEIVPADQANVPTPSVGEHIRVTASWVTDHEHEWDQIHPVWKVEKRPRWGLGNATLTSARRSSLLGLLGGSLGPGGRLFDLLGRSGFRGRSRSRLLGRGRLLGSLLGLRLAHHYLLARCTGIARIRLHRPCQVNGRLEESRVHCGLAPLQRPSNRPEGRGEDQAIMWRGVHAEPGRAALSKTYAGAT
jgi:hypothetical protein